MRHFSVWLAAAATFLSAPGMADEAEPLQLEPSSAWVMDYADDSCALRRSFGQEGQSVWFEMRQFSPSDSFDVTIASEDLRRARSVPVTRFEPDNDLREQERALFSDYGNGVLGILFEDSLRLNVEKPSHSVNRHVPEPDWNDSSRILREKSITGLYIGETFSRDLVLQTGEMHSPMKAMRACTDELLTHWGIDATAHKSLSREAEPRDMERWVSGILRHYPTSMLRDGNNGRVRVRLLVGTDGKAQSCHIQMASRHEEFEDAACKQLVRYARFEPALDSAGHPILSYWTTSVTYMTD